MNQTKTTHLYSDAADIKIPSHQSRNHFSLLFIHSDFKFFTYFSASNYIIRQDPIYPFRNLIYDYDHQADHLQVLDFLLKFIFQIQVT